MEDNTDEVTATNTVAEIPKKAPVVPSVKDMDDKELRVLVGKGVTAAKDDNWVIEERNSAMRRARVAQQELDRRAAANQ